jgi:hypothetical protein
MNPACEYGVAVNDGGADTDVTVALPSSLLASSVVERSRPTLNSDTARSRGDGVRGRIGELESDLSPVKVAPGMR